MKITELPRYLQVWETSDTGRMEHEGRRAVAFDPDNPDNNVWTIYNGEDEVRFMVTFYEAIIYVAFGLEPPLALFDLMTQAEIKALHPDFKDLG